MGCIWGVFGVHLEGAIYLGSRGQRRALDAWRPCNDEMNMSCALHRVFEGVENKAMVDFWCVTAGQPLCRLGSHLRA